ncbi:MAG TPA: transposase [Thermoanaerobaculia bacterium]|nr:transposase [Thermoanaerobaculia bacterium]
MGRRLRYLPPEGSGLVEVTCRTLQGRFLLTPSTELNEIILGVLGRTQELYPVSICAFAFASNHFHLLLRVESTHRLSSFMGYFNSNLAREAGRRARWGERFWGRRYQAIPISEEEAAQVERLRYILAHGCKEGLVERLRDWPGVSAVRALLEEESLEGLWFDRTREHCARRRGITFEPLEFATPYTVQLEPLPCWAHLSAEEHRRRIAELVDDIEGQAALKRQLLDLPARGPEAILAQEPQAAPETLKKSPAPLFHAASRRVRRELYEAYKYFLEAFRDAAVRLRAGEPEVVFPAGSFPPAAPWVAG